MERVGRRLLEAEPQVPRLGRVVLGMDEEYTRADDLGCFHASQEHVLEQRAAETCALVSFVDREASEEDRGHRARSGLTLERSLRRIFRGDLGRRDRVVADNGLPVFQRHDEHARGV